jgi:hypothetical protein
MFADTEFLSNKNKAMIWQLLDDKGAFLNIPNTYLPKVKELYEKVFEKISNIKNISLVQQNKLSITEIMKDLSFLKTSNISKPLEEVQIQLNKDFENKQNEFINLIKRPTPEEVNFEDNNDLPLNINEMDSMLNKMIALRETELNQIQPENPQQENPQPENPQQEITNNTRLSSHGGECNDYMWSNFGKIDKTNSFEKHVSFETANNNDININNDEFITKLKKNNTDTKPQSIDVKLTKILINQEKILKLLRIN